MKMNPFENDRYYLIEEGRPHIFQIETESGDLFEIIINYLYIQFDKDYKLQMTYDADANLILPDNSKIPIQGLSEDVMNIVKKSLHKFAENLVATYLDYHLKEIEKMNVQKNYEDFNEQMKLNLK